MKNSKMLSSNNVGPMRRASASARNALAVRFFIRRSQRFGDDARPLPRRQCRETCDQQPSCRSSSSDDDDDDEPREDARINEGLMYLGLAPRNQNTTPTSTRTPIPPAKTQSTINDDNFARPLVMECDYCPKIFFNKTAHRRHTIKHMRLRRCCHCNQAIKGRQAHRRHELGCKQLLRRKNNSIRMF